MRHRRQIGDDCIARDVFAQHNRQCARLVIKRFDKLAQAHHFAPNIGEFDADHGAPGDSCDARRHRRHVASNVVSQLDHPARLDAARRFKLIHGDDRTGPDIHNRTLHVKIVEY